MIEIPRHPHALRSGISIAAADPARKHSAASAPCLFVNQSPLTAGLELIADGIFQGIARAGYRSIARASPGRAAPVCHARQTSQTPVKRGKIRFSLTAFSPENATPIGLKTRHMSLLSRPARRRFPAYFQVHSSP